MITMIVGVITITGLLVTRMPDGQAAIAVPDNLQLPDGAVPEAVTMGKGWIAVVTSDARILIFGANGQLLQQVKVLQGSD